MQRKPPAKRLFSGMTGSAFARVNEPAPAVGTLVPAPIIPKRRGPKPKLGVVMTPAERKRKQRITQAEPEKRQLIAEILKITKRGMGAPTHAGDVKRRSATEAAEKNGRERLLQLRNELMLVSIKDLRKYHKALKDNLDPHGRLHNESSGGDSRVNGMSRIERIIAAQQRAEHGGKTRLEGHGPESYEDTTSDCVNVSREPGKQGYGATYAKAPVYDPLQKTESQKRIDNNIDAVVNMLNLRQYIFEPGESGVKCPWCDVMLTTPTGAENHLYAEYTKVENHRDYIKTLEAYEVSESLLNDAKRAQDKNEHVKGIKRLIRDRRRLERKLRQIPKVVQGLEARADETAEVIT